MSENNYEKLQSFFEDEGFFIHLFEEDGQQGAEIEKWTYCGVDMITVLMPFSAERFIEYVEDFNVDEEIDDHRRDPLFRSAFTIAQSLKDFTDFHEGLKQTVERLMGGDYAKDSRS
jgi:hypothetical protein